MVQISFEAHLRISGASGVFHDVDILDPSITGFPKSEVAGVDYSSNFPLKPYLKKGVAEHWGHACYGSGAYHIKRRDGKTLAILPLFFADENLCKNPKHFSGHKHWNTEFFRFFLGENEPKLEKRIVKKGSPYDIHQVKKTKWLKIIASGTGFSVEDRIDWVNYP